MNTEFMPQKLFDFETKRIFLNGEPMVIHCHHYVTLLTQLAEDAERFCGAEILYSSAEESFHEFLNRYYHENHIISIQDRTRIAEQYYSYIGMGLIKINIKGQVEIKNSYVDEGWIIKWGTRNKPVNYISQGFIAGAFSAITDNKLKAFKVNEYQSIVCGAETSKFTVEKIQEQ